MSESPSNGTAVTTPPPAPAADDRRLRRLLIILAAVLGVLVVAFAVVYYLGQRADSGPTLNERAVASAEQAVKDNPDDVGLRLSLAATYEAQDMTEQALAQYDEVLRVQKDNRSALIGSAMIHYKQNDLATAGQQLEHVIEVSGGEEFSGVDPQLEKSMYFLGQIRLKQGDYDGAIKELEAALKIDATDADAWYTLGQAQSGKQNYEKAAAAYLEGLRFVPVGWCEPYDGLQTAYEKLNRTDGMTFSRAMAAICRGDAKAGMADLEKVTEGEFQIPALLGLGQAAQSEGDTKAAISWYRKVRDLDPTNVAALSALAQLGDTDTIQKQSASPEPSESSS